MKWNHLPEDGGVDRQHPVLMERFRIIHSAIAAEEERNRKKEEARNNQQRRRGGRGSRGM